MTRKRGVKLCFAFVEFPAFTTLLPASLTKKGGNGHKDNLFYGNMGCFATEMIIWYKVLGRNS